MAPGGKRGYYGETHVIPSEDGLPRMVRPRAIRPRPVRVQDAIRIDVESFVAPKEIEPPLVRPVALKPCAIPPEVTEEFYARAHQEGFKGAEVHAAVMESQDWHRKWTYQDEKGHTLPEKPITVQDSVIPSYYAFNAEEREMGAKNPSPDDRDFETPILKPVPRMIHPPDEEELDPRKRHCPQAISPQPFHEPVVHPVLVRPIARRPSEAVVQPSLRNGPPQDIMLRSLGYQRSSSSYYSISPMTLPSVTRSSSSVSTYHQQTQHPAEILSAPPMHIIEPETTLPPTVSPSEVQSTRDELLHQLAISGGETSSPEFQDCLERLQTHFTEDMAIDTCAEDCYLTEGTWLTLTNAIFFANLGENDAGDPLYTLGRMSFDMFSPTQMVCSLQGNFNSVQRVCTEDRRELLDHSAVPKALREEVEAGNSLLRTYNVLTAFTIELPLFDFPNAPNKDVRRPIRGLMTTFGYTLPDPEMPNRHSVWITGGKIEPNDNAQDRLEWKRLFDMHPPQHSFGEKAKLLLVQLLMGATIPTDLNEDLSLDYTFTRPLGGHGSAYVDTLYVDDTMRIVRGHRGTTFVFSRHCID